jgi:hypothetical protein
LLAPARVAFREALLLSGTDFEQVEVSVLGAWAPAEGAALALIAVAEGRQGLPKEL